MRVNQAGTGAVQNGDVASAKKTDKTGKADAASRAKASATTADGAPSARAEISARAKELAKAKDVASKTPDVREEKIAELKKRIASGQYQVDSNAVADRMVAEHLQMS